MIGNVFGYTLMSIVSKHIMLRLKKLNEFITVIFDYSFKKFYYVIFRNRRGNFQILDEFRVTFI